jgi:hypothetical protein
VALYLSVLESEDIVHPLLYTSNEPVEKVGFLKSTSSAKSKIGNYFHSAEIFTILAAMLLFP